MKNSLPTLSIMAYPNKFVRNWGFKIRNIIKLPHPKLSKNYYYYYLKNGTQYWLLGKVIAYLCVRVYIYVYIFMYMYAYMFMIMKYLINILLKYNFASFIFYINMKLDNYDVYKWSFFYCLYIWNIKYKIWQVCNSLLFRFYI